MPHPLQNHHCQIKCFIRKFLFDRLAEKRPRYIQPRPVIDSQVVREHYLRTDIPCGSELCSECNVLISQQSQNGIPFSRCFNVHRYSNITPFNTSLTPTIPQRPLYHSRYQYSSSLCMTSYLVVGNNRWIFWKLPPSKESSFFKLF